MKTNSDTTTRLYIGLDVHKEKTAIALAERVISGFRRVKETERVAVADITGGAAGGGVAGWIDD